MSKTRRYINAEALAHSMKLRQLGGDITILNSKLCYVKFNINGIKLKYAYNLNKHNKFFLERLMPYPRPIKEYDTEDDVIEVISIDIEQFKNIDDREKLVDYIRVSNHLNKVIARYEDLFLYYDIDKENLDNIKESIEMLEDKIRSTKEKCKRIYYKKDPDEL